MHTKTFAFLTLFSSLLIASAQAFGSTPTPTPTGPMITGRITYSDTGQGVPNAVVLGQRDSGDFVMATTDETGRYELRGFQSGTYTIRAIKSGGPDTDRAVSSLDAAMIIRFVAAAISFSPMQRLAADMSGDGQVTSFDAALAGRFANGNDPNQPGWLFSPATVTHTNITSDITDANYTAVVLGDVTQNWVPLPPTNWTVLPPTVLPTPTGSQPNWTRCDYYAASWGRPDWPGTQQQPWDIYTGLQATPNYVCISAQP